MHMEHLIKRKFFK